MVDEDPMGWVMQRERARKRITYTCECGYASNDEWLAKGHRCLVDGQQEEGMPGYCVDYPCCGHEAGDCFGQKYGSDESIKAFWSDVYSSGMDDYEIDQLASRMDGDY